MSSKSVQDIKHSVKGRVMQLLNVKVNDSDRTWIENV